MRRRFFIFRLPCFDRFYGGHYTRSLSHQAVPDALARVTVEATDQKLVENLGRRLAGVIRCEVGTKKEQA